MINAAYLEIQQDTIRPVNAIQKDTLTTASDSLHLPVQLIERDTLKLRPVRTRKPVSVIITDTTSVCQRSRITDITFYDSTNLVLEKRLSGSNDFPYHFIETNREIRAESRKTLIASLKPGAELPERVLHEDWITGILILAAFLFGVIRIFSKDLFSGIRRYFLFKGVNDPSTREIGGIFGWQSTILNLISFTVVAVFVFLDAKWHNIIPFAYSGIVSWLVILGTIIISVTIRHITCLLTGNISSQREMFREYLHAVYQFYRFTSLFLFVIIALIAYTTLIAPETGFIAGAVIVGTMYLFRTTRLLIIFLNRNISIFYLILYLCALEILPVLISVRYFAGLI